MNKKMDQQLAACLDQARHKQNENSAWFGTIKQVDKDLFLSQLTEAHSKAFKNTDCLACANCCKTTPALITQQDVKRLAKHLALSPKQFVRAYTLTDYNGEMMLNGVPCKFLNQDNTCQVYEIRPAACKRYPHTDEKEYPLRKSINLANTLICPAAYKVTELLKQTFPLS